MAYFKEISTKTTDAGKTNAVVMGRRTWESIPAKFRPLPGRVNIVLTRCPGGEFAQSLPDDVHVASSLDGALQLVGTLPTLKKSVENLFVIGGAQLYAEALTHEALSSIHLTVVEAEVECDTFIPDMSAVSGATSPQSMRHGRWTRF
jgi:dihydrofolate reductase/thymidylate synthase